MVGDFAVCAAIARSVQPTEVDKRDSKHRTPLHCAALKGHTNMCAALCRLGANIGAVTGNAGQWTALHLAAGRGHVYTCNALVKDLGADIHQKDAFGATALHLAARAGNQANNNNNDNIAPVHANLTPGHTKTCTLLVLQLGADVQVSTLSGFKSRFLAKTAAFEHLRHGLIGGK